MSDIDDRWREKYYDKVAELNFVEKSLFDLKCEVLHLSAAFDYAIGQIQGLNYDRVPKYLTDAKKRWEEFIRELRSRQYGRAAEPRDNIP